MLVPLGVQYLIYPANEESPPAGGEIARFNARHVAGYRFLAAQMELHGYLIVDRVHGYWLLRGCPTLPASHPLRCVPSKLVRWKEAQNRANSVPLVGTTSIDAMPDLSVSERTRSARSADVDAAATETGGNSRRSLLISRLGCQSAVRASRQGSRPRP